MKSLSIENNRAILNNDHSNDWNYSEEHDVNEPVNEPVDEDAVENEKRCLQKSICEAVELIFHISRETPKDLIDKLLRFLRNSPITAEDYSTYHQNIKMCEDVLEEHAREKLTSLVKKK